MPGMSITLTRALQELQQGFGRWNSLRQAQKSQVVHIACDNDITMMFVKPDPFHVRQLKTLFTGTEQFAASDQAISLAERISSYLFRMRHTDVDREPRFSLPGHSDEFVRLQGAALHATLADALPGYEPPQIAEQVRAFEEHISEPLRADQPLDIELVVNTLSGQAKALLGFGTPSFEWTRLHRLVLSDAIQDCDAIVDFPSNFFTNREFVKCEKFWRGELAGDKPSLEDDAFALASLELINRKLLIPKGQLLVLVSGADHVWNAAATELARRLGESKLPCPLIYRPWDLLDECHLDLTGGDVGLQSGIGQVAAGKLSGMLTVALEGDGQVHGASLQDFLRAWNLFLQVCLTARVDDLAWQGRQHLRRVRYAIARINEEVGFNAVESLLAGRGQRVLNEAAELGLLRMRPQLFHRSAPFLYFDNQTFARKMQLLPPADYLASINDPAHLEQLESEAGNWYTRHLLTARAFIWAGKWDVCRDLCVYALNVRGLITRAGAPSATAPIDGREAWFLLAVAERHVSRGQEDGLTASLQSIHRFQALIDASTPMTDARRVLCHLRAANEIHAIDLTRRFVRHWDRSARAPVADAGTASLLAMFEQQIVRIDAALSHWIAQEDASEEVVICLGLLYQAYVNVIQITLIFESGRANLAEILSEVDTVHDRLRSALDGFREAEFSAMVIEVARSVVKNRPLSPESRRKLDRMGQRSRSVFQYDRARVKDLIAMTDALGAIAQPT